MESRPVPARRSLAAALLGLATTLSVLVTGCAHEVESKEVTLSTLTPDLVCNQQLVTPVVLAGSGFAPLPTNVLAKPAALVLPTVKLTRSQDLTGAESPADPVTISGEPDGAFKDQLTWQSQAQMTLTVIEELGLVPGLHDVTVTQPDETHSVTKRQGLAVVPPPVISSVEPVPPVLCTDQEDRTFTIRGENFLTVAGTLPNVTFTVVGSTTATTLVASAADGCVAIPGTFAGGTVELCSTLTVILPQGELEPAAYDVIVTNPPPAACVTTAPARMVIVPPPLVSALVPPGICVDQEDQTVRIQGGNFVRIGTDDPDVTITSGSTSLDLAPTAMGGCAPLEGLDATAGVEVCDEITIVIPANALPPGSYTVTITNPDPAGCSSTETVTLTVNPPPVVTSIAPRTVCTGGSELTITGTDFQQGATVELRCPNGTTASASTVVNTAGTQIDATFGLGPLAGDTCDVVVLNPDGCEDRPLPHQTATVTEGPIAFYVDPPIVFNGLNTRVTVYVTSVAPPVASVRIRLNGAAPTDPYVDLTNPQIVQGNRIQATVPAGTAPGTYDLVIDDDAPCSAVFVSALVVTDTTTLEILRVDPPFGKDDQSTAVQILRDTTSTVPFSPTPRAFLNPTGTPDAIGLVSLSQVNADTLTAVVPTGTPAGVYDLVVINPTGEVGVLTGAYTSLTDLPPVVADITPQSITSTTGRTVTVTGSGFRGSSVSLDCRSLTGAASAPPVTSQAETCATPESCTQTITIDASTLSSGTVCVVRVTNADGSYGDYSALGVTGTSFNLETPGPGTTMNQARRALVSAAAKTTATSRYVYAIGGDGGSGAAATPFASVEFAPVTVFGGMQAWVNAPTALGTARSFAAGATLGRYVYVMGGSDGTSALNTAERALILSPEEVPTIVDVALSLCPTASPTADCPAADSGLEPGQWAYRVSAVFDAADPHNPGGESLASDPFVLKLPSINTREISVRLSWAPPVDNQGAPLGGVTGYRVYRTPVVDGVAGVDEVLIGTVTGATEFLDDGSATPGTERPLPPGSTGQWTPLPDLGAARVGASAAVAEDPATPGTWYVYTLLGKDSVAATGGAGLTSYEFLTVTTAANGYQTVGTAWTAGTEQSAVGRWQFGTWVVDRRVSTFINNTDTWIYLGGGRRPDGTLDGRVEAGLVAAGGQLGAFADDPTAGDSTNDFSSTRAGYGVAAAANRLFTFGGAGGDASSGAAAAGIVGVPDLANNSWNSEGLTMNQPRYLMGSSIQSAFIFLVGGDVGGGVATNTSEAVVW